MTFSRYNLHWGMPPVPITHRVIDEQMTPEQTRLLMLKCQKQAVKDADLTMAAIGAAVSGAFGKKPMSPSDAFDRRLGYDVETEDEVTTTTRAVPEDVKELSPQERRRYRYARWGWTDEQLIDWLVARNLQMGGGYELEQFFTDEELGKYGICLLKGASDDGREP